MIIIVSYDKLLQFIIITVIIIIILTNNSSVHNNNNNNNNNNFRIGLFLCEPLLCLMPQVWLVYSMTSICVVKLSYNNKFYYNSSAGYSFNLKGLHSFWKQELRCAPHVAIY